MITLEQASGMMIDCLERGETVYKVYVLPLIFEALIERRRVIRKNETRRARYLQMRDSQSRETGYDIATYIGYLPGLQNVVFELDYRVGTEECFLYELCSVPDVGVEVYIYVKPERNFRLEYTARTPGQKKIYVAHGRYQGELFVPYKNPPGRDRGQGAPVPRRPYDDGGSFGAEVGLELPGALGKQIFT